MSKYQTMPTETTGGPVPTTSPRDWLAKVEELSGRQLGKADRAYAFALAEHHNWTATVVADHLRMIAAASAMVEYFKDSFFDELNA